MTDDLGFICVDGWDTMSGRNMFNFFPIKGYMFVMLQRAAVSSKQDKLTHAVL